MYAPNFNPMKDYFLPMALEDLALFHVILFSSTAFTLLLAGHKDAPQSLVHLKECIHLINERLQSASPAISDSTLVIVATLAYLEVSLSLFGTWPGLS